MHQEREYPRHISGSVLHNPDFAQLAKAYGALGFKVQQESEFADVFNAALNHQGPSLIEILIEPELITTRASLSSITQKALANSA
jgi:acetolactate synthase-1/2/3 large subunit